jgi:type II secretion system protein L
VNNKTPISSPHQTFLAKLIIDEQSQLAYQWWDAQQQLVVSGNAVALVESLQGATAINIIAPAESCTLKHYPFEASEAKVLRQTLPYSLEDELLTDVDELHFALGEPKQNNVAVAIVETALIQSCLNDITEAKRQSDEHKNCVVKKIIPELMLLPWLDGQWTLCVDDSDNVDSSDNNLRYLLRSSVSQGFSVKQNLLDKALTLLMAEQGLPTNVVLYCPEHLKDPVKALLPDELSALVLWQRREYWSLLADENTSGERVNLLQAGFIIHLQWRKWWQQWQGAAAILAVLAVAQVTYAYTHNYQLEAKNLELRTAIEQAYRSAIPKGAVVDAERQLRRKVSALQGGSGEGFVSLLAKIATVTAKVEGFEVQSLNYNEKQNEVRLTVLANSFNEVETVRSRLQKQGVQAELSGSSNDAGKTRARLRIRG